MLSKSLRSRIIISVLVVLTVIAVWLSLSLIDDIIVSIILVALILLLWPIGFLAKHYWQERKGRGASQEAAQDLEAKPKAKAKEREGEVAPSRPSRSYKNLESGAAETADFLRRNRMGATPGADAIYSVPWFLIAGPPASGKTSLMLSAGLSFSPLKSQRQADLDLLRPTGDCEWRITDNAVLIDSAGRYQTEGDDRDEWIGLIDTLKRYRKQRPLDGLVMTVSAASLLAFSTLAEVEQQARILRARLNELISGLGAPFPVYLVFTHIDTIPGFADFFGALDAEDRSGVWGAMIPLAEKERAHALFDTEFDHLLDSLMTRRLPRLGGIGGAVEQLGVFDFPLHFSVARQRFGVFTTALFSPNPFSEQPRLRGIYFTSAAGGGQRRGGDGRTTEMRIRSKGFFAEGFFKQVLRRDAHVAAAWQNMDWRPSRIRKLVIAAASLGVLLLLLMIGMIFSYFNNKQLIADSRRAGGDVLRHLRPSGSVPARLPQNQAEDLDRLQNILMDLDDYEQSWFGTISYRFGMYTGGRIRPRLREIYFDFIAQRLLNPTLGSLVQYLNEKTPSQSGGSRPEQAESEEQDYYDRLKAYLMLERQERVDSAFLQQQLSAYWKEGQSAAEMRHLSYYAEQASISDDEDQRIPRPQTDSKVVAEARKKLANYAPQGQVYNEIIGSINKKGEPYRSREVVGGQQGSQWFDSSGSLSVPYTFTKEAYYEHVKGEAWISAFAAVRDKSQNDWVLQRPLEYQRVNANDLRQRYEKDYITAWKAFLDGMQIKKFKQKSEAVDALDSLSQQNSPFTTIFDQVKSQTTLSEPPISGGVIAWFKSWVTSKERANTEVEKSFAAVKSFKLENYLERLKDVRRRLADAPGEDWRQVASLVNDDQYKKARDGVRELLTPLKANPGSASVATLLGRPLDNIEAELGQGVEQDRDRAWAKLRDQARGLENRYPFSNVRSGADVPPDELATYISDLSKFYDQFLRQKLGATPGEYGGNEISAAAVAYFKQMFRLRDALGLTQAGGPGFTYTVMLQPPPGQLIRVAIDGQTINSEGGPGSRTLSWPSSGSGVEVDILQQNAPPQRLNNSYSGPWGLFKMVAPQARGTPPYRFNLDRVRVSLNPQGGDKNPFTVGFTGIRAPENIAQ